MIMKRIFCSLAFLLTVSFTFARELHPIPSIAVQYGSTKGIDLRNYTLSEDGEFRVDKGDNLIMKISNDSLYITLGPDAAGYIPVKLWFKGNAYNLMVKVIATVEVMFRYEPAVEAENVYLMGNFNDWSRTADKMRKTAGGGWLYRKFLKPGKYEYKFVRDGLELLDPSNPDSIPNGLGGFNSLLNIGADIKTPGMFIKNAAESTGGLVKLSYTFLPAHPDEEVELDDITILFNNRTLERRNWKFKDNELTVYLPRIYKSGLMRIFAENTLSQTIPENHTIIKDGAPLNPEQHADDWHFSVIYSLIVDRFFNGDLSNDEPVEDPELNPLANFQGGDIAGVKQKLAEGYFTKLGVNALWISPIIKNPKGAWTEYIPPHRKFTGYHGYWPVEPRQTDPRFTDESTLRSFVADAHRSDIKVLLDFVSNHTHEDHPYFKEHRDWFGNVMLEDSTMNIRNWSAETMLTTWFDTFLPSFDYVGSPEAIDAVTDDAVFWLEEYGFDGFRQDATKHVPHSFWKTLRKKLNEAFPGEMVYQIGESFGSDDLILSYVNPGELDSQFNFTLYFNARWQFADNPDFPYLNRVVKQNMDIFQPVNLMGTLTSSHDQVRFIALADGQVGFDENGTERAFDNPPRKVRNSESYDKLFMFTAFNMSLPGVPVVYYGEEIGQIGANDPDNRRMMRFGSQLSQIENEMISRMSNLIKARRNYPALSIGDLMVVYEDREVTAWLKSYFNENLLVLFNNSGRTREFTLILSEKFKNAASVLDQSSYPVDTGTLSVAMDAYETKILTLIK